MHVESKRNEHKLGRGNGVCLRNSRFGGIYVQPNCVGLCAGEVFFYIHVVTLLT